MKQKDIFLVVAVVLISATTAFILSKYLITIPKDRQSQVEVVQAITADFPEPDSRYLNGNSIDLTKNITIGDSQNQQPFSSGQ